MTIRDAWSGSAAVRWLFAFLGAALVSAAAGYWTLSAQVNHMAGTLDEFMAQARIDHARYERHIERADRP